MPKPYPKTSSLRKARPNRFSLTDARLAELLAFSLSVHTDRRHPPHDVPTTKRTTNPAAMTKKKRKIQTFISRTPNPVQDGHFPLENVRNERANYPKYISSVRQVATRFRSSQALSLNFEQLSSDCKLLGRLCAGLFVRMRIAE